VPEIAIRLAFWRAAACTMEATNGPAVQSLTWHLLPTDEIFGYCKSRILTDREILILKNRKPIHRQILKFSEAETRISIDYPRRVPVLSMTCRWPTPLFDAVGRGSALLVV
jgi:hypothetical protein